MTSWHEPTRRGEWREFLVVALSVPLLFFGLDALLTWVAGWFV